MLLKVENINHGDYSNPKDPLKDEITKEETGKITKCTYKIRMCYPSKCGNKVSREEIVFDSKDDILWITDRADRNYDSVCREGIEISMISFYDEFNKKVRLFINFKESKKLRIIEIKMLSGYIYYSVCYYLL